ncbi:MAG: tetratricopeptide repeat protein [Chitinivibrionales bacterium]|nr:tetratricopeptide repeat protein [Chitinivibrionales bacterium]
MVTETITNNPQRLQQQAHQFVPGGSRIFLSACMALLLCHFIVRSAPSLSQEQIDQAYSQSYSLEKAQNYLKAIEALYPVVKAFENGYTINYRLGWLSYLNGNLADGLRYLAKALAVYPSSIEVMNCISLIHSVKLDWKKVEEENLKIVKVDYYNITANYWYAYSLKLQKKYDNAIDVARKMLIIYPTSVTFLYELAENLYFTGKYTESYAVFVSIKTLDPSNKAAIEYINLLTKQK